jgi:hypothetical protein
MKNFVENNSNYEALQKSEKNFELLEKMTIVVAYLLQSTPNPIEYFNSDLLEFFNSTTNLQLFLGLKTILEGMLKNKNFKYHQFANFIINLLNVK